MSADLGVGLALSVAALVVRDLRHAPPGAVLAWGSRAGAQAAFVFAVVCALVVPLGTYMARVFEGERTFLSPVLAPVERGIYAVCRIRPEREMSWRAYAFAVIAFGLVGAAYLYAVLRTQAYLPLNPQRFGNLVARPRLEHGDLVH